MSGPLATGSWLLARVANLGAAAVLSCLSMFSEACCCATVSLLASGQLPVAS